MREKPEREQERALTRLWKQNEMKYQNEEFESVNSWLAEGREAGSDKKR